MALTARQKEIQALQRQGKSAAQIAKALGISVNAVYQQKRRMKRSQGGSAANAKATRSGGRQSPRVAPTAPAPAPTVRDMTPLQAVRAKREELTGTLKEAQGTLTDAQKAVEKAQADVNRIEERIAPELAQLDAAEAALKGDLSLPKAKPASRPKPKAAPKPAQAAQSGGGGKDQGKAPDASESAPSAPQSGTNGTGADPAPASGEAAAQDAAAEAPQAA